MTHASAMTPEEIGNIARRIDRPVVLVGLMGVGKSTVGRRLAAMLGTDFIDVDDEIERAADRSVSEIFAAHGEAYFRDGERRVIARLMDESHGVIATGGGAFVDPETRALILERAIAVWLDCDIDTLVERTSRRDNRPLLRQGNPREILTELKDRRGAFYAEAQVHVVTDDGPHIETAQRILGAIDAWL
ncbi:shikimate kinase [Qipengyuania flava]|uniref:shikimate kinase n=1 Tax=Qipengyuania flava TaxID=192812 RepID=UPI001C637B63|nr:shikimate kinase [Qipengyuania flava]QYJ08417.1 shikimate kinase [Qipengyuania flava]